MPGAGGRRTGEFFNGYRVLVWDDEKVLEIVVTVTQIINVLNAIGWYT